MSILPKTTWREGAPPPGSWRGWNSILSIWTYKRADYPVSIMAQERAEWGWKHKKALAVTALPIAALIAAAFLVHWIFALAAVIAYFAVYTVITRLPAQMRAMEYFGHAVSVVVGEQVYGKPVAYFEAMHLSALTHSYDQFRGIPEGEVLKGLRAQYPAARKWAKAHDGLIRQYQRDVA